MTYSSGGQRDDRGVMRPGSRRNWGTEAPRRRDGSYPSQLADGMRPAKTFEDEVNAYAESLRAQEAAAGGAVVGDRWDADRENVLSVEQLPTGETLRVLAPGYRGDMRARDSFRTSRFQAEKARIDLADALLDTLSEGGPGVTDTTGGAVPVERLLGQLGEWVGVDGRQMDPGIAQRTAEWMSGRSSGTNLPADKAFRLATAEASGNPSVVRKVFQDEGLGLLLEQRAYVGPQSFGGVDNASGEPDTSLAWVGTRPGYQALGRDEQAAARELSGKGRKMGPGKGRNKLDAEVFAPTVVEGTPYVPMLLGPRSQVMRDGALHAPLVSQPKYDQTVGPERTAAWQLATYGDAGQRQEGMERLKGLRAPGPERMVLNERGNAGRSVGYDPSALRMGMFNPRAVLDPAELVRVGGDPAVQERVAVLAGLIEDYATTEALKDKTATGSFDVVGVPNPDAALADPGARVAGLQRELDPAVQRTKGVVYPTLGTLVQRIMQRHRTPMHTYLVGSGEGATVMAAPGGTGTRFREPVPDDVMVARDDSGYYVIERQHRDGTAVVGPRIFPMGDDPPQLNEETGQFYKPFRVGTNLKMTQAGFDEFEAVVNGLMASRGMVASRDGQPTSFMPVGNSWVRDPATNAAQNLALRELFGDELLGQTPRFRGEFPGAVERQGAGGGMDPYRNPLVGTMDLMERLARAVSEEETDAPAVLAPTDREYAETWGDVVRPKLEAVQKVQQERAASAPGMRASDGYGGRIYQGPVALPQADRPGILPTNAVINQAPLPEGIDMPTLQRALARPDLVDRGTLAVIDQWVAQNAPRQSQPIDWSGYPQAEAVRAPAGEQLGGEVRGSWLVKPGATERPVAGLLATAQEGPESVTLRAAPVPVRSVAPPAPAEPTPTRQPDYGGLLAQAQAGRQQRLAEEAAVPEDRTKLALAKARLLGLLR